MSAPTSDDSGGMIARVRAVLAAEPLLRLAIVFGSTARGTAGPESDIDIGFLPASPLTLAEELELEGRIERELGRAIDLVRLDLADPGLQWRIAREGIVVLANPANEAPRFLGRVASEHDELAALFEDASRRYAARVAGRPR